MAQDKRARLISVLLLVLTLVVGFMFGLAWSSRQPTDAFPVEETAETGAEPEAEETIEQADTARNRGPVIYEVQMDPNQRAGVDEIIRHLRSNMRALNDEAQEDYQRYDRSRTMLLAATQDSIKAILNPDQIAEYDSLLEARYPRNRDGRGDPRRERRRDDRQEDGEGC